MNYQKLLIQVLRKEKGSYIELNKLANIFDGNIKYENFGSLIMELISEGYISGVKASGENYKNPSLHYKYKIHKGKLNEEYHGLLNIKKLDLHQEIKLDQYYKMTPEDFQIDLPYIEKINTYLQLEGIPKGDKAIPGLSFELVNDEKWIEDKGGRKILKRLKLWDKFSFIDRIEPLAFAIDIKKGKNPEHYHLIVENKTPFQYCVEGIEESIFTTIIYGKGWQVVSSIKMFEKQLNLEGDHIFYYFGDIDRAGIEIWNSLNKVKETVLATKFYQKMLKLESDSDKENQLVNEEAIHEFNKNFDDKERKQIIQCLEENKCYPQEILSAKETMSLLPELKGLKKGEK